MVRSGNHRLSSLLRITSIVLQVSLGVFLVFLIIHFGLQLLSKYRMSHLPAGWKIMRPPTDISALLVQNDIVWCGGKEGLALFNRRTGTLIPLPKNSPRFGFVRALLYDQRGNVWVGHDFGLARYAQNGWTIISPSSMLTLEPVLSLCETRNGDIWVGGQGLVMCYGKAGWREISLPKTPRLASIDVIFEDRAGAIWLGCSGLTGGLLRYAEKRWQAFGIADGLPHPAVDMLMQDNAGTIWVATGLANRGGLATFAQGRWRAAPLPSYFAGVKIRSIFQDRKKRYWIGSEYDGIAVRNEQRWRRLTQHDGLAGNEIKVVVEDCDGQFWLGSNTGLTCIAGANLQTP